MASALLAVSGFLDAFGRAERVATCSCERTADASVSQALHLNNGRTLNEKLRDGSSIVSRWVAEKRSDALDYSHRPVYTRFLTTSYKGQLLEITFTSNLNTRPELKKEIDHIMESVRLKE